MSATGPPPPATLAGGTGHPEAAPLPAGLIELPAGLPAGLIELSAGWFSLLDPDTDPADPEVRGRMAAMVTAPLRLEPTWPPPIQPRPIGPGWFHDESIDEDRPVLDHLISTAGPAADAEGLAAAAQRLRLPVVAYRRPGRASRYPPVPPPVPATAVGTEGWTDPTGRLVVDLSTHWAGPLAGALLAERGARVIKIDPDARPDGFRERRSLYTDLNGSKDIVGLDLRQPADRARFEGLLRDADLIIESFSRRVMPNLGYDPAGLRACGSGASVLAVRAFPVGTPESDWLAYGPGVHAMSGLGFGPEGPRPCPVAYPDVVAGLAAAAHGIHLLSRPQRHREISLASAIAPLTEAASVLWRPDGTGSGNDPGQGGGS